MSFDTRRPMCDVTAATGEVRRPMPKLFAAIVFIAFVMVTSSCTSGPSPPTFQPLPTATVPPDLQLFRDEANLFSIQYPAHWELDLSILSEAESSAKELLLAKDSDLVLSGVRLLFFASPRVEPFQPNVVISAETLPGAFTVDEYYKVGLDIFKALVTGLIVHETAKGLVGGRESIIDRYEYDASSFEAGAIGKLYSIDLAVVDGRIGRTASCGLEHPPSAEDLNTCDAIVRSFKILQ